MDTARTSHVFISSNLKSETQRERSAWHATVISVRKRVIKVSLPPSVSPRCRWMCLSACQKTKRDDYGEIWTMTSPTVQPFTKQKQLCHPPFLCILPRSLCSAQSFIAWIMFPWKMLQKLYEIFVFWIGIFLKRSRPRMYIFICILMIED